jgi:uncharacterized protein involved in outer membrane biogenesis
MRLPKVLRWIAYVVGGLVALLLVILVVLSLVQIPIDLTKHKSVMEAAASRALGRTIKIDGNIGVTTSLWPSFKMQGLRITNPEGFQAENLAKMENAKVQVSVLPLFFGKIHVEEFSVKGVALALEENKQGAVSWATREVKKTAPEPKQEEKPELSPRQLSGDSLVVEELTFEDISVSYKDSTMSEPYNFKIDQCTGSGVAGKPFDLAMKGTLFKEPFTSSIKAGSLQELLKENRSWMEIQTEIAKTTFELAGNLDLSQALKTLQVRAAVKGDRLDSLNSLLELDLPPLKSYGTSALLSMQEGRMELSDFEVYVGESKLTGKMLIDNTGSRPKATIALNAKTIQFNDFDLGDWSPKEGDSGATDTQAAKPEEEVSKKGADQPRPTAEESAVGEEDFAELFSPEVLAKINAEMKVTVEEVLSGTDKLGSGLLTATLKEGRFSLDPVKLNIPGGAFQFAMSVKPGRDASEASVRAVMENFDFGVLARRAKPDTDMGGTLNLNVDLKSNAKNLDELLANGNGYFDFSGQPVNLNAGIIDLWAVNVIAAIAAKGDEKKSKINCLVGRWTMKDGLLTPDAMVIDTSRIRICVKGQVNFKKEQINITSAPAAKKPEYFSLATPIGVHGKFTDFEMGIEPGGILGTAVTFLTSPVITPMRRMVGEKLPEDGSDVCSMAIGPNDRPTEPPLGCGGGRKKTK